MEYEEENKAAVIAINSAGGDGKYFSIGAPKLSFRQKKIAVTTLLSRERQDALKKTSIAGADFFKNAGGVANCGDYFISQERRERGGKDQSVSKKEERI